MITNIGWACIRARLQYLLKKTGIQQLRSEIEDGSSNDDHNLHHRAAERPRRERGIHQPVQGKLRSLIATETYTTGGAAFEERHQGDRQRSSTVLNRRELHHADRSTYGGGVESTANKELAAAAREREEKRRNHEN